MVRIEKKTATTRKTLLASLPRAEKVLERLFLAAAAPPKPVAQKSDCESQFPDPIVRRSPMQ